MMAFCGVAITEAMRSAGAALPRSHALWTLEERPALHGEVEAFGSSVWPESMLHDATGDAIWRHLGDDFAALQLALLDADGSLAAVGWAAPLAWDGSDPDLPKGWDAQFVRSVAGLAGSVEPDTLGATRRSLIRDNGGP